MPLPRRVRVLVRWLAVLAGIGFGSLAMLVKYGTAPVDRAFRGSSPASTCRVLSAPLEPQAGDPWDLAGLRASLAGRGAPEAVGGRPRPGEFAVDGGSPWLGARVAEETGGSVALVATPSGLALADAQGAALLAGLIAAPNRVDPLAHPEAARSRRNVVLAAMGHEGHLDAPQARAVASAALPGEPHRLRAPFAVHFVEYLLANTGNNGELASTLDVAVQRVVREGCQAGLHEFEARYRHLRELARGGDPLQAAVVVLAPDGRLMAMQGSRVGLPGEFNRAAAARRQIGSLVKPFVVGAALQAGWPEGSMLPDEPLELTVGRQLWHPENSDGRYRGWVTVHDALMLSLNVSMVRLGLELSVSTVAETLRHAGFSVDREGPALLLGAVEASPLEVARACAVLLARGGRPTVRLERGTVSSHEPVLDPSVAANVRATLEDVPRLGIAAVLAGGTSGPRAAKTGPTDERRGSWFVARRPGMVTVVWVGTDGSRETELYRATGALEVWRQIARLMPPVRRQGEF